MVLRRPIEPRCSRCAATTRPPKTPKDDATHATDNENSAGRPKTGGNTGEDVATDEPNATADATWNPADRAKCGNSGNTSRSATDKVPEVTEALRQLFEMHPETREQDSSRIAEDLYIWTDLGYEPDPADVTEAMKEASG